MNATLNSTQGRLLQHSHDALGIARSNTTILNALNKYGYNSSKLSEGEELLRISKNNTIIGKTENAEFNSYRSQLDEIRIFFSRHKELSKRLFKNAPERLIVLGISGLTPKRDSDYILYAKRFYTELSVSQELLNDVQTIGITPEILNNCHDSINQLIKNHQNIIRHMAEQQETTVTQLSSYLELKEWMEDFDNVAHIAFYDQPQLLEWLGLCA